MSGIHGAELTLLLLCSFALGNLVQEAGDRLIKRLVDKRFFRQARDRFWTSGLKQTFVTRSRRLGGPVNSSVDAAFDFCLTCLDGDFAKRDVFLGNLGSQPVPVDTVGSGISPARYRTVLFAYGWNGRVLVGRKGQC